jgi:hypothetical protein
MAKLVKITEMSGADVYVNPDMVAYVRLSRSGGGNSTVYFTKDFILEAKEEPAKVVTALTGI